ncbi:LysR substrate-binding domain-containing protein [Sneathiella chinensis]|uniref:LysR family transcriptional regulator n=1 Tax=Sneathiella chinensis TaxID=349750 RepID=A0ABQ5U1R5_9PROT|nr:LysR substrate-binding domain-containing protein [Sneathiella chinensis]GLQ06094.1 LysR family transcriptional regulator [Sneathiella chinensis]
MIRLRQLEAFRAVMLTGGVTQAAHMLHISQPAVSKLISSLEQTMGIPLFERRQGRLHPTHEAEFLIGEIDRAIASLEHIAQLTEDIRNQKAGHLRIACLPGFATSLMPEVVAGFLADREKVTMSIQTRSSARVREWIAAQQYDIGVADEFEGHRAVIHESVNIRTVCALSPQHPLAAQKVIRPEDLSGMPMIIQDRGNRFYHLVKQAFDDAGAILVPRVEVRQFATACILAKKGVGAAIVSSIDAAEYAGRGLITRPFEPSLPFRLDLLYPKYHPRSLLLQEFIKYFRESLQPFTLS